MIIGNSEAAVKTREFIKVASVTDYPILLWGETGVGKTLVARMIHLQSRRRDFAFIHQNCSNIPEALFESDLFGHERGAFTGAVERKIGKIEIAHKGTLLFDEMSDLSIQNQAKILLFIERGRFYRLGGKEEIEVDVRIIGACNNHGYTEMKIERLREDLFYRISVLNLYIPPLRDRGEDILLLADHILKRENHENCRVKTLGQDALNKLVSYHYPGNIRELENIIRRAYIFSQADEIQGVNIDFGVTSQINKLETAHMLYNEMAREKKSFYDVVHQPFLKREINRREVRDTISLGLRQSKGSYKRLLKLFNAGEGEKAYKRFMKILATHGLKISTTERL